MLEAVQRSAFTRFTFRMGSTHLHASRTGRENTGAASNAIAEAEVVQVAAPRVGVFHSDIAAGTDVNADTVIGRIRSFETMVAVKAGRAGSLVSLRVANGSFVEYRQLLAELQVASVRADP